MSDQEKRKFEGTDDAVAKKLATDKASAEWALGIAANVLLPYMPVTEEEDIPALKVGTVIGAKGVIIQEIMRRSQCKIVINQDFPEGHPRKIIYNGLPNQIASAKELIAAVIIGGALALQTGGLIVPQTNKSTDVLETVEIDCPQDKVGLVIGTKGMIIQDLMRRTGCKISIKQDMAEGLPRKIIFNGTTAQIAEAQTLIYAIIHKGTGGNDPSDLSKPVYTKEMDCPQDKVGVVIGSKGVIIQEIMRRTACKMVVNQDFPDGCPRKVVMTGTENQINAAIQLVEAVISQGPAALHVTGPGLVTQDINIVQAQVGKIIGPGGTMIKDIQQRCGVKMVIEQEYADTEDRKIRVTGESDRVQAAVTMVCQLLDPIGAASMSVSSQYGATSTNSAASYGGNIPMPGTLALGADGTAGQLLPATPQANGTHSQIVLLKKTVAGKVIGKNASTLNLIKAKSGAALTVEHSPDNKMDTLSSQGEDMCRININGYPQSVVLASQMVQEVLVNGATKLQAMPDHVAPQQQQYAAQLQAQAAYAQQQQYLYQQYYGQYAAQPNYAAYSTSGQYDANTQQVSALTPEQLYQQQYQQYYAQYMQAQQAQTGQAVSGATAGTVAYNPSTQTALQTMTTSVVQPATQTSMETYSQQPAATPTAEMTSQSASGEDPSSHTGVSSSGPGPGPGTDMCPDGGGMNSTHIQVP
mmetsp:Transcript_10497/g.10560  ORF Transcript_10497/g.10560 Transcript_10497/m.10560 type:complete len:696 (-) Transcript_10497:401-2488(-)